MRTHPTVHIALKHDLGPTGPANIADEESLRTSRRSPKNPATRATSRIFWTATRADAARLVLQRAHSSPKLSSDLRRVRSFSSMQLINSVQRAGNGSRITPSYCARRSQPRPRAAAAPELSREPIGLSIRFVLSLLENAGDTALFPTRLGPNDGRRYSRRPFAFGSNLRNTPTQIASAADERKLSGAHSGACLDLRDSACRGDARGNTDDLDKTGGRPGYGCHSNSRTVQVTPRHARSRAHPLARSLEPTPPRRDSLRLLAENPQGQMPSIRQP